jgi:hypothetical protein
LEGTVDLSRDRLILEPWMHLATDCRDRVRFFIEHEGHLQLPACGYECVVMFLFVTFQPVDRFSRNFVSVLCQCGSSQYSAFQFSTANFINVAVEQNSEVWETIAALCEATKWDVVICFRKCADFAKISFCYDVKTNMSVVQIAEGNCWTVGARHVEIFVEMFHVYTSTSCVKFIVTQRLPTWRWSDTLRICPANVTHTESVLK